MSLLGGEGKINEPKLLFSAKVYVDRHVSKKNGRDTHGRGRRRFPGKSPKLRTAENTYMFQLLKQKRAHGINEPIRSDVHLLCRFYFKNYYLKRKKVRSRKLNDQSNLYELPQDILKKAGIIEDDCQVCSHDGSRRLPGDSNYTEIFIYEFTESVKDYISPYQNKASELQP